MDIVVPFFEKLFNNILNSGIYPSMWCEAILCPIYKQGDKSVEKNYRGISLLNSMSKIFTKIMLDRLTEWAYVNEKEQEEQAAYKTGYSTIDHIFTMQAIVQQYLTKKKGRFYCIFVDFSQAFDTIVHKHLWYKIIRSGIHGKFLNVLRSMYGQLTSCDKTNKGSPKFLNVKSEHVKAVY